MMWSSFACATSMRAYTSSWSWPSCIEDRPLWLTDCFLQKVTTRSMFIPCLIRIKHVCNFRLWCEAALYVLVLCVHIHHLDLDHHALKIGSYDWLIAFCKKSTRSMFSIRFYCFNNESDVFLWYDAALSVLVLCVHINDLDLDHHAMKIGLYDWLIALYGKS